jgi:aryl-alcohol dehydrogenase-like predicted oxidoreductase
MKYNFLGNTGLLVSEICFGTMTFGGKGMWESIGKIQQQEVNELMKAVVDAGINFIDTANVYSFGESEKLLGQSIIDLGLNRNDLVIATKVRGKMGEGINNVGLSRYHIFQSVNESLQRLQLDHIDILYVHGVDKRTPVEETMRALNDIVLTGKVRYVAVCNWPAWMVMKALGIAEAGGFLSGKYTRNNPKAGDSRRDEFDFPPIDKEKAYDIVDVIAEIGKQYNASAAQIALAWVRQQPGVTSTIIGAKRIDQLHDNIKSTDIQLTADNLEKIDAVSALGKEYPGWMVEFQGRDR